MVNSLLMRFSTRLSLARQNGWSLAGRHLSYEGGARSGNGNGKDDEAVKAVEADGSSENADDLFSAENLK